MNINENYADTGLTQIVCVCFLLSFVLIKYILKIIAYMIV